MLDQSVYVYLILIKATRTIQTCDRTIGPPSHFSLNVLTTLDPSLTRVF